MGDHLTPMPFADPEKLRAKNREYSAAYRARQVRVEGVCSVHGCKQATEGGLSLCPRHHEYRLNYKREYRKREAPPGSCRNYPDCTRLVISTTRTACDRCALASNARGSLPAARAQKRKRNQQVREEGIATYGGACACCGETNMAFLTIDHVNGYDGVGPRGGSHLCRWLKKRGYPDGFRVLCMSCNYALGHHGYCPHGDIKQACRVGRHTNRVVSEKERVRGRAYWIKYKLEVFSHYGGATCSCCGESHHEVLQVDHVAQDGAEHRRENPAARKNLVIWLRRNGYPPGFRILCANCNFATYLFGTCPHKGIVPNKEPA